MSSKGLADQDINALEHVEPQPTQTDTLTDTTVMISEDAKLLDDDGIGGGENGEANPSCAKKVFKSLWFWNIVIFVLILVADFTSVFVSISANTAPSYTTMDKILEGIYTPKLYYNKFVVNHSENTEYLYYTNGTHVERYNYADDKSDTMFNLMKMEDEYLGYFINKFETNSKDTLLIELIPSDMVYRTSDFSVESNKNKYPKYLYLRDGDLNVYSTNALHEGYIDGPNPDNFDFTHITESHVMTCYDSIADDCLIEMTERKIYLTHFKTGLSTELYNADFEERRTPSVVGEVSSGKLKATDGKMREILLDTKSYYENQGVLVHHVQPKITVVEAINSTNESISFVAFATEDTTGQLEVPIDVFEDLDYTFHTNTKYVKFNKAGHDYFPNSSKEVSSSADPSHSSNIRHQLNIYLQNGNWCRIRQPSMDHDSNLNTEQNYTLENRGNIHCGIGFFTTGEDEQYNVDDDMYLDVYNPSNTPYLYAFQTDPTYYKKSGLASERSGNVSADGVYYYSRFFLEWRNLQNSERKIQECIAEIHKTENIIGVITAIFTSLECSVIFTDSSGIRSVLGKDNWNSSKSNSLVPTTGGSSPYGHPTVTIPQLLNHPSSSEEVYYPILLPVYQSRAQYVLGTSDSLEALIVSDFTDPTHDSNSLVAITKTRDSSLTSGGYKYSTQVVKNSDGWEFVGITGFVNGKLLVVTTRGGVAGKRLEWIDGEWDSLGIRQGTGGVVSSSLDQNFTIEPLAILSSTVSSSGEPQATDILTQNISLTDSLMFRPSLSSSSLLLSLTIVGPKEPVQCVGQLSGKFLRDVVVFNNSNVNQYNGDEFVIPDQISCEVVSIPAAVSTIGYNFVKKVTQYEFESDTKSVLVGELLANSKPMKLSVKESVRSSEDDPASARTNLNAQIIYPPGFDKNRANTYATIVVVSAQTYYNIATNDYPYAIPSEHLALCVVGRAVLLYVDTCGSGLRGREFEGQTRGDESSMVASDLLAVVSWLKDQKWSNKKIGLIASGEAGIAAVSALGKNGSDAGAADNRFTAMVLLSPGTDWSLLSSLNTQPTMGTPSNNEPGFASNSSQNLTRDKVGRTQILIMHGTADEIWHFQNSVVIASAFEKIGVAFEASFYPNYDHVFPQSLPEHAKRKLIAFFFETLEIEEK